MLVSSVTDAKKLSSMHSRNFWVLLCFKDAFALLSFSQLAKMCSFCLAKWIPCLARDQSLIVEEGTMFVKNVCTCC